jgi:hypothetical protein
MVPTVAFLQFAALGFLEPPVDLEITLEVVEQHKGLERWKDVQNVHNTGVFHNRHKLPWDS